MRDRKVKSWLEYLVKCPCFQNIKTRNKTQDRLGERIWHGRREAGSLTQAYRFPIKIKFSSIVSWIVWLQLMKFKLGSLISYLEERLFTRLLKFAIFSGPVRPNLGFSGSVQYFQVKAHLPEINSPPISSTKTSSPAVRCPSSSVHLFPNQPDLVG